MSFVINNKKVLAIIPARGRSKGIPGKNIKIVNGKPLLAWTIDHAKASKYIDRVILSSDDEKIMNVARKYKCEVPFKRPKELATDAAGSMQVLFHAMEALDEFYDYVVLLQATSPLRAAKDIDACIERCEEKKAPACVSVVKSDKSPYWMFTIGDGDIIKPIIDNNILPKRRQDAIPVYLVNGAVYVAKSKWIKKQDHFLTSETLGYVMPRERSIDIDTPLDLKILQMVVKN
jgi:CMP-N,N'-diacetyllegionaminic acid synthase